MDWGDPKDFLARVGYQPNASMGSMGRQVAYSPGTSGIVRAPAVQDYGNTAPWMMNALAGAARGLSGALEPFQLPQDILFSFMAGWADPNKSALDYFRSDESIWEAVKAYAPGGIAPDRPASGEQLLRMFGVQDERAAKWGGIAMDLVADPLLAGAWLKGAGLAARGMGATGTAAALTKLGSSADYATSLVPLYKAIPKPMRESLERDAFKLAQMAFNKKWLGAGGEDAKTVGDMLLPRRTALRFQMQSSVTDKVGRDAANFIARTEQTARRFGMKVQEQGVMMAQEALDELGGSLFTLPERQNFITRGLGIIGLKAKSWNVTNGMPTALRQVIAKDGWEVIDNQGIGDVIAKIQPNVTVPQVVRQKSANLMVDYEKRVRTQAARIGYNPDEAWDKAQAFVQKAAEADGMLGYHLSGYEHVYNKFDDAAKAYYTNLGNTAQDAEALALGTWNDALLSAANGTDVLETVLRSGGGGATAPKLREMLDGIETFSSLNVDTFMRSIFYGHLRRAYGVMQDAGSFERYTRGIERGKVFLSNVLDDTFQNIPPAYSTEFGYVRELVDNLNKTPGVPGASSGTLLSRDVIVGQLLDKGVSPERIRETLIELVAQQNPVLARPGGVLDRLRGIGAELADRASSPRGGGVFSRGFFEQRKNLDKDQLQLLGEFANPIVSLSETAAKARTAVPFQTFMREVYENASTNKFVMDPPQSGRYMDPVSGVRFVKIPDEHVGIWGAFAGKLVHPFLKKEMLNAMKDRGGKVGSWDRIRSLITGGYLASPNVIMANMSGGFMQAAMLGVTPDRLLPKMASTLKKLIQHDEQGKTYDVLEIMAKYFDLDDSTLVGANLAHGFKKLELSEAGLGADGVNQFFTQVMDGLSEQLKRPGIGKMRSRWFGLDGFQFVERWFKVAAFEAEYDDLIRLGKSALDAEQGAAEIARMVVFDYSELPGLLVGLRDKGLLMFPGFNYFLLPRTLTAAVKRPGVLSVADRMSDAVNNSTMDEEEKLAVYASMPEWLRTDQGAVVNKYEGEDGTMRYSAIPMNQLIPTVTFAGNPWGESISTVGLWRPIIEALYAAVRADGEAVFSGRYGQRVFDPGATRPEQVSQTMNFLMSNFTPGFVRKLGVDPSSVETIFDQSQGPRGLLPNLISRAFELNEPMGELAYSLSEMRRERPDRSLRDEVLSFTLRAPQVIATGGALANIQAEYTRARQALGARSMADRRKLEAATLSGNTAVAEKVRSRILKREEEFVSEWQPRVTAWTQGRR